MTNTAAPASAPAESKPELKAAPPQLNRRDNPVEVRQATSTLSLATTRLSQMLGGVWITTSSDTEARELLLTIAEQALFLRRLLTTEPRNPET